MHTALIGIGSNLGDRQANILQALQKLRAQARIDAVSSFLPHATIGSVAGPAFLNVAVRLSTDLEPAALERLFRTSRSRSAASTIISRRVPSISTSSTSTPSSAISVVSSYRIRTSRSARSI